MIIGLNHNRLNSNESIGYFIFSQFVIVVVQRVKLKCHNKESENTLHLI